MKLKKCADLGYRPRKLASNLKIIITKIEKILKSEKFMLIFVFLRRFKQKLS